MVFRSPLELKRTGWPSTSPQHALYKIPCAQFRPWVALFHSCWSQGTELPHTRPPWLWISLVRCSCSERDETLDFITLNLHLGSKCDSLKGRWDVRFLTEVPEYAAEENSSDGGKTETNTIVVWGAPVRQLLFPQTWCELREERLRVFSREVEITSSVC